MHCTIILSSIAVWEHSPDQPRWVFQYYVCMDCRHLGVLA